MRVRDGKEVARRWVIEEAAKTPGFDGAYFAGSINWLSDDADLPATSDVDVWVVLADQSTPGKLGKFAHRGVTLDVSHLSRDCLQSHETVLADYHVAGSFWTPSIISDPSGQLAELQAVVSRDFAKRLWVLKRCEHARNHVLSYLQSLKDTDAFHDQVTAWLFANGVMAHVLLVAGLKNPTVRRRYVLARELLAGYCHLDFYETLLEMLGCGQITRARVEHHLAALSDAFDAAKAVVVTPLFFIGDISDIARPIVIEGSRELIDRGLHREAVFWIVATYARCQKVLHHDAPSEMESRYEAGFRELLADLGISSFADLQHRALQVAEILPRVWGTAEAIVAANPEIMD